MTPTPEPMTVSGLVDDDAVDPGPQARLPSKSMDRAEDPEEDFLRQVKRLFPVAQQIGRQLEDDPLMFGHQLGRRVLIARGTTLHQRRFAIANVRPTDDTRLLHPEFPKSWRCQVAGNSSHYNRTRRPNLTV
jgi:hypothetical protein